MKKTGETFEERSSASSDLIYRKIRAYYLTVIIIIIVSILSIITIIIYSGFHQARVVEKNINRNFSDVAHFLTAQNQIWINHSESLLNLLSNTEQVKSGDIQKCSEFLNNQLKLHTHYLNFGVATLDGNVYCSGAPLSMLVNILDRKYFQDTVQTKKFSIGEYQVGRITGKPTVNFGYPILDERGNLKSVVFAALSLSWLNDFTRKISLPENSVIMLLDLKGIILSTNVNSNNLVGMNISDRELIKQALNRNEISKFESSELDGIQRQYYSQPIKIGDNIAAYIILGIPQQDINKQINSITSLSAIAVAILISLAVIVIYFIGRRLFLQSLIEAHQKLIKLKHEAEISYAEIIENAPDPILIIDKNGTIVVANRAALAISGLKKSDILGKNFMRLTRLVSARSLLISSKYFTKMLTGKLETAHYEIELVGPKKQQLIFEVSSRAIRSAGKLTSFQVILRDITQRKQFEKQILKEKKELERLNRIMVNREVEMLKLKKENEKLREKHSD